MFDYDLLRLLWWALIGLFMIGIALTTGFDLGLGVLLPILGRTDTERRVIINAIAGTWEGNQVWLVAGGATVFAVWPLVYATLFSVLYLALMLVLLALLLRPVGFDYRSKLTSARWRSGWDWALCVGSAVPALLLGVVIGNLLLGLPFDLDGSFRPTYHGSLWDLLQPFALLCGVSGMLMLLLHGAVFLQWRTDGLVYLRARNIAQLLGALATLLLAITLIWLALGLIGFQLTSPLIANAPSDPLIKTVVRYGSWLHAFPSRPWLWAAPSAALAGTWGAALLARRHLAAAAFISSSCGLVGALCTVGLALFPFILPSAWDPPSSLTLWDATASKLTLTIVFWLTVICLPMVIAYTRWVYRVLWGVITEQRVERETHDWY